MRAHRGKVEVSGRGGADRDLHLLSIETRSWHAASEVSDLVKKIRAVEVLNSHPGKAGNAGKASNAQSASCEFGGPARRRLY